jgi:hypothetical protein
LIASLECAATSAPARVLIAVKWCNAQHAQAYLHPMQATGAPEVTATTAGSGLTTRLGRGLGGATPNNCNGMQAADANGMLSAAPAHR